MVQLAVGGATARSPAKHHQGLSYRGVGAGGKCLAVVLLLPLAACVCLLPYLAGLADTGGGVPGGSIGRPDDWGGVGEEPADGGRHGPRPAADHRGGSGVVHRAQHHASPAGVVTPTVGDRSLLAALRQRWPRSAAAGTFGAQAAGHMPAGTEGQCLPGYTQLLTAADGSWTCVACPRGEFSLPAPGAAKPSGLPLAEAVDCRPYLSCSEIADAVVDRRSLAEGGVKRLSRYITSNPYLPP